MKKITVLGAGLVGGVIARDLARGPDVLVRVVDVSEKSLARLAGVERLETRRADVSQENILREQIADADVVVSAVPSRMGYPTLHAVLQIGKPICDICFSSEDPLALDGLAKER